MKASAPPLGAHLALRNGGAERLDVSCLYAAVAMAVGKLERSQHCRKLGYGDGGRCAGAHRQ